MHQTEFVKLIITNDHREEKLTEQQCYDFFTKQFDEVVDVVENTVEIVNEQNVQQEGNCTQE